MTLYSCLLSQGKITVLASWPGKYDAFHSVKVTTCTDARQASLLADDLTRVSEAMWDASAWLDVYEIAETRLSAIVDAARGADDVPYTSEAMFDGCRHKETLTGIDLSHAFAAGFAQTLNSLTRAQRLSVADELTTDAAARVASLDLLPTGYDPSDGTSRIWQAADITPAIKMGMVGALPEGAAGWVARVFDTDRGPAQRWGARNMLHRLEQLEAAAMTIDGHGGADLDPVSGPLDHIVLPAKLFGVRLDRSGKGKTIVGDDIDPAVAGSSVADAYREYARTAEWVRGDAVLYIGPDIDVRNVAPWDRDVFAKINIQLSVHGGKRSLALLDATDSVGFVGALGNWVTNTVYRG